MSVTFFSGGVGAAVNKNDLIEKGRQLYALAIYQALREVEGGLSVPDVVERYSGEDASGEWSDLGNEVLLSAALRWMQELRLLDVIDTGFAPPFLIADDPAPGVVKSLQAERNSMFYYYARVKGSRQWLVKNLEGVNRRANELWLSESDLSNYLGEWEPLPLDRETELLQDATEKVDVTLDLVKGDNGFAAHHPAERTKAVHDLSEPVWKRGGTGCITVADADGCGQQRTGSDWQRSRSGPDDIRAT